MVAIMMVGERLPGPAAMQPDLVGRMKEKLRRAVLTLLAMPDPDKKYLRVISPRWVIVRESAEAYGWTPERVRFAPNPRDVEVYLEVLAWLSWYEREQRDEESVKLFIAWATGAEYWQLSRRFAASERTLRRRIENLCDVLCSKFEDAFQKIFLDECHVCQPRCDSPSSDQDLASEDAAPPLRTEPSWIADGELPSADETIPAVAADRTALIERLERQNRKRKKARKRHEKEHHHG